MTNFKDITGQVFHYLKALEPVGRTETGRILWKCKCKCGKEIVVDGSRLRSGNTKSCGCLKMDLFRKRIIKDYTGRKFGKLTILKSLYQNEHHHKVVLCRCDCGNEFEVMQNSLVCGRTTQCKECQRKHRAEVATKHGGCESRLYSLYTNMKQRCYYKNRYDYKWYGGRGIIMCKEWFNDFNAFKSWAVNNGYDEKAPRGVCTIERIDVNGNYCPENCKFITIQEQAKNRTDSVFYEVDGVKMCLVDTAKFLKCKLRNVGYMLYVKRETDPYKIFQTGENVNEHKIERIK